MATLKKWQVWCNTDSRWEHIWLEEGQTPTTCPVNTAHSIGNASVKESREHLQVELAGVPKEHDGKNILVTTPATEGWMTWFTGAGDDPNPTPPASGRGMGQKLNLEFTGAETKEVEIQFNEPVELHDGALWYTPVEDWSPEDRWHFSVRIPATVPVPNTNNPQDGNCNLVDSGKGYNVIVPAAGDGTHDITDYSQANPVPAEKDINTGQFTGHWDADYHTGVVAPSPTPGTAEWLLLDVPVESFFLRNMPAGNPRGVYDLDAYQAEWIPPQWKICLKCERVSANAAKMTAWVMCFREKST